MAWLTAHRAARRYDFALKCHGRAVVRLNVRIDHCAFPREKLLKRLQVTKRGGRHQPAPISDNLEQPSTQCSIPMQNCSLLKTNHSAVKYMIVGTMHLAYRSAPVGKLDMGGLPVGGEEDEARGAAVECNTEATVTPRALSITRSSCIAGARPPLPVQLDLDLVPVRPAARARCVDQSSN